MPSVPGDLFDLVPINARLISETLIGAVSNGCAGRPEAGREPSSFWWGDAAQFSPCRPEFLLTGVLIRASLTPSMKYFDKLLSGGRWFLKMLVKCSIISLFTSSSCDIKTPLCDWSIVILPCLSFFLHFLT